RRSRWWTGCCARSWRGRRAQGSSGSGGPAGLEWRRSTPQSGGARMRPAPPPSSPDGPFPYGWRYVQRTLPSREVEQEQVPLTLEDVLHPREGDVIPERLIHERDRRYLAEVFGTRPLSPPATVVTSDLLIDWGVPGLGNHAPDVAVFVGLSQELDPTVGTLRLAELGGRCLLVVEVVSPATRSNDVVQKGEHYHTAGVPLYGVVDWEREDRPRRLRVFRDGPLGYREETPGPPAPVLLEALGLELSLGEDRVVCRDARTGSEVGDYA